MLQRIFGTALVNNFPNFLFDIFCIPFVLQ